MTSRVSTRALLLGKLHAAAVVVAVAVMVATGNAGGAASPRIEAAAVPAEAASPASPVDAGPAAPASAEPAAAPAPPPPPPPLTVPEKLNAMVASVAGRDVAVSVVDASGAPVVEYRADAGLVPASTAKLVTAAAALAELGAEFQYRTRVNSTAPVADGVIVGDVVLIGSGDPTLSTGAHAEAVPERPRTPFEGLADQIAAAGTKHITGSVLADWTVFPDQPFAAGVKVGGDSAPPSSGLTINAGRRVWRDHRGLQSVVSDNPAQEAANNLAFELAVRGITIDGGAHRAGGPVAAPLPLAEMASPPLIDLLRHMVQTSDNHIADAVFRTIGAKHGDASWAGSAAAVTAAVGRVGLDVNEIAMVDGSGLSHDGRATARGLVHLDEVMARSPLAGHWYSLHAVASSSGTLKNRMLNTPASGRVGGKTGTLQGVRAFTGFVTDGSMPRFRLAVIGNGLDDAGIEAVMRVQDEMAIVLAERAAACAGQSACPAAA